MNLHIIVERGYSFAQNVIKCFKSTSINSVRFHLKLVHAKGKDLFAPCRRCGKLLSAKSVQQHMNFAHSESIDFKCDMCSASFKRPVGLRYHM